MFEELRLFEYNITEDGKCLGMRQIPSKMLDTFTGTGLLVLPNGKRLKGEWI